MSQFDGGVGQNGGDSGQGNSRRALWIMAAAGLFLLVVVGAALIISSNRNKQTDAKASDGWIRENESALDWNAPPSDFDAPDNPFDGQFGIDGVPPDGGLSLDDLKGDSDAASPADANGEPSPAGADASAASPDIAATIDLSSISPSPSVTPQNEFTAAQMESSRETARAAAERQSAAQKPAVAASRPASPSRSTGDKYWVQVGSFEDINKANAARSQLSKAGLPAEVFTYEDGGRMMYRVRVGSYPTKSEAEGVREKVSALNAADFGNSFVVNSTAKKQ